MNKVNEVFKMKVICKDENQFEYVGLFAHEITIPKGEGNFAIEVGDTALMFPSSNIVYVEKVSLGKVFTQRQYDVVQDLRFKESDGKLLSFLEKIEE